MFWCIGDGEVGHGVRERGDGKGMGGFLVFYLGLRALSLSVDSPVFYNYVNEIAGFTVWREGFLGMDIWDILL